MFTPRYPDFRGENRLWRNNFSPVTQLARCLLKHIAQVHQKNGMGDGSIKQDLETAIQQVARTQFACLPTPLMRLHNLERQLGYDGLYIKRDDLTGLGPGGNKLRSLEFIVGEAAAKGRDNPYSRTEKRGLTFLMRKRISSVTACTENKIRNRSPLLTGGMIHWNGF